MNTKRIASLAAPLLIAAAAAAPAHAVVAGPVTAIQAKYTYEGTTTKVIAKANCPTFRSCLYRISAESGSAIEGTDFTAVDRKRRVKRSTKKTAIPIVVKVVADGLCEPAETFTVTLTGTGEGDDDSFVDVETQTIPDEDCAPEPAPEPAPTTPAPTTPAPPAPAPAPAPTTPAPTTPAPAFPADSGTPTETTTQLTNGTLKECRTPYWIGQKGAFGAQGYYNSGCTVKLTCPSFARTCQASGEGANNSEANRGENVSLNSRLRAFSASNTQFWFRDQSCAGTSWCRTEDMIMIRGGESISNQCNGVRAEASDAEPDRHPSPSPWRW